MSSPNVTEAFATPQYPTHTELKPPLLSFMSDEVLGLMLPLVVYWSMGIFFQYLNDNDYYPQYRLHTPEELAKRNKVTVHQVIRSVIFQHLLQTAAGLTFAWINEPQRTGFEAFEMWQLQERVKAWTLGFVQLSPSAAWAVYYVVEPSARMVVAFLLVDTWQFFLHMLMHKSSFLYRHLHSVHHRLFVPYAYGALYNSILEGFLLDTLGTGLSQLVTGLTPREAIILYTFSTMKTVDDHCGYSLPLDPFQFFFPNNAAYHDIHHQHFGIKTNYAQPFFTFWDKLFGTEYREMDEYIAKQKAIREEHCRKGKQVHEEAKKEQ